MRRVKIMYDLSNAWEQWIVEVPDDTTEADIRSGVAEVTFMGLEDAGNNSMSIAEGGGTIEWIDDA